ncbi:MULTISPECIES: carboxylesterase/lipase family protein [unclassified Brevundimonas]|uniref:carboxylesterase/lipase family protein n=2 Tax=Brevundimonas TaxID=41275 RepID=UPI00200620EA|nr:MULTISPECIES: carboxylesterase/lipase family protein [unclassified Brevundimonas]MCK6105929.1 carboxylesterase/lipase family protein [Brevundimonas sp. EYE_349]
MITRRKALMLGMTAAALPLSVSAGSNDPRVQTTAGPVIGVRYDGVSVFKGLRYGAPTQRFRPPRRPEPWRDPIRAGTYGAASPQRGNEPNQSEDCLFLNIWTPGTDAARRPVMVYIHGGAYSAGSGSDPLYDGARLATRGDVVVVTLNHRLNVFGYAYLARLAPGFEDSGNAGQLDLILALQWVRDNIAAFGGDPLRVMLFGQSGGGAKIATLMAMPAAQGLFHRAATMSGQQVTASGPINATTRATAWLKALGLTPDRAAEAATMPVERLLEAQTAEDPILGFGGLYFGPVLDFRSLPRHPFYPDAAPMGRPIPMIIGNTREETLGFMGDDPRNQGLTWDTLAGRLTPGVMRIDITPEAVIAGYRAMHPDWSPDRVLIAATTAGRSWRGAVIEAEERARARAPAWVYQLDFPGELTSGRMGAFHTADIPLVFDNVQATGSHTRGPGAQSLSDRMSDAFIALARDGDPNHAGLPRWDRYELPRRQTMLMDVQPRMADDPRGDERAFFSAIPYIQPGT